MMKSEFEKLIGKEVTPEDYEKIETVYNFHPSIDNVKGKEQISSLYLSGGMGVIGAMLPGARFARLVDNELQLMRLEIEKMGGWKLDLEIGRDLEEVKEEWKEWNLKRSKEQRERIERRREESRG